MSSSRPVLIDASFLIDLERETARRERGPARTLLASLRGRRLIVSVVTVAEILEGARDAAAAASALRAFSIQGIHHAQAVRCALLQRRLRAEALAKAGASRRLGENDAWLVATAESIGADVAGADRPAFERLGDRYRRFR